MISIIIVGKNEGFHLSKCIESAQRLIHFYSNLDFEIIYVDSKSTDKSVDISKSYNQVRVFIAEGHVNSAVARNIGANVSKGGILFFVDADMEIQSDFLRFAINDGGNLVSDFVTGHIDDYLYTNDGKFIRFEPRTYKIVIPKYSEELNYSGGMFLTSKEIWNLMGGMNTKFRRSQDFDFTLRLKKRNYKLIRLPILAVLHHTVDYNNEKRMWKDLFEGNNFYPGLILRKHLTSYSLIVKMVRSNYSALLLMLYLISFSVNGHSDILIFMYFFVVGFRVFIILMHSNSTKKKVLYFLERILYQVFSDLSFWFGFFFFFPKFKIFNYKEI